MNSYFNDLFLYNDWANREVLNNISLNKLEHNDKIIGLISHLLSAQFVWHLRIKNLPTAAFPIRELYKYSELVTMNEDSTENWKALIKSEDLSREISYTTFKGEPFSNTIQDIMIHVVNHSTYHRAQIATSIRFEGNNPPKTDYILFKR